MRAELIRCRFRDLQTTGEWLVYDDRGRVIFDAKTMELDMDGNKEGESCIPMGEYDLIPLIDRPDHVRYSLENYGYFPYLITPVPQRTGILVHHANFYSDLLGCVGLGDGFTDIDGDGYKDITNSIKTMKELNKVLKVPVKLTIKGSQISRNRVEAELLTQF